MKLRISKKALEDIEGIWLYTVEKWSIEQADRYYDAIFDEIDYIVRHPLSGTDYSHVRQNYRCSKVKSHLIFYCLGDNSSVVEIIRVLHQRMDIEHRLSD